MAGSLPGFDPVAVRAGIRLAMQVGLPVQTADQPTFYFKGAPTTGVGTDGHGAPLAWDGTRSSAAPKAAVQVPCAIDYQDDAGLENGFGPVSSSRLVLTLLDEDYDAVKGFAYVAIGGNRYDYERTEPPMGLVSVGVWQVHVRAVDEG